MAYATTRVSPFGSVKFTYRERPSGEKAIPSSPCSLPPDTRPDRSSTGIGSTRPLRIATTFPVFSAM